MTSDDWRDIESAPQGRLVMTKIDDANGSRNEQALKLQNHLFFVPDGSMYVYYQPTHWRPLTTAEAHSETDRLTRKASESAENYRKSIEAIK